MPGGCLRQMVVCDKRLSVRRSFHDELLSAETCSRSLTGGCPWQVAVNHGESLFIAVQGVYVASACMWKVDVHGWPMSFVSGCPRRMAVHGKLLSVTSGRLWRVAICGERLSMGSGCPNRVPVHYECLCTSKGCPMMAGRCPWQVAVPAWQVAVHGEWQSRDGEWLSIANGIECQGTVAVGGQLLYLVSGLSL